MDHYKLIFSGPVGVGKTSAVAALSQGKLLTTEEIASDMTRLRKDKTTVAFDYACVELEGGERLHIYGTPGQERFDFMWDILTAGGLGLILLLDNSRGKPFGDLRFFVSSFRDFIDKTALVVGVTRTDSHPQPGLDEYRKEIASLGLSCPVFEVDARVRENVLVMVQTLLYQLNPELTA